MRGTHAMRSAIVGLLLAVSPFGLAPGIASAQSRPAPVTLRFYEGSGTPVQIDAEPWAAVFIDGRPASLAALRPGLVADIAVDGRGRAVEIDASSRTVTGTVASVRVASGGDVYVVIGGRSYEARLASAVVAQGGTVVGGLVANQSLLDGNVATLHLGPDGRVGYVDLQ